MAEWVVVAETYPYQLSLLERIGEAGINAWPMKGELLVRLEGSAEGR